MAQIALGVIGAAIGLVATSGSPAGAAWGWAIGSAIGGYVEAQQTPNEEPRVTEKRVSDFQYGASIPKTWGSIRVAGFPMYMSELDQADTTYTCDVACGICEGPIGEVLRIWANGILIFNSASSTGAVENPEVLTPGSLTLYKGDEDQLPDATLEGRLGAGNVPGYRGTAYIVIEAMLMTKFGNRFPNFEFEVSPAPVEVSTDTTREEIAKIGDGVFTAPGYLWRLPSGEFLSMDPDNPQDFLISRQGVGRIKRLNIGFPQQQRAYGAQARGRGDYTDWIFAVIGNTSVAAINVVTQEIFIGMRTEDLPATMGFLPTGIGIASNHLFVAALNQHVMIEQIFGITTPGVSEDPPNYALHSSGIPAHTVGLVSFEETGYADVFTVDKFEQIWGFSFNGEEGISEIWRWKPFPAQSVVFSTLPYKVNFKIDYDPDLNGLVFVDSHLNKLVWWDIEAPLLPETFDVTPGTSFASAIYEPTRKEWYTIDVSTGKTQVLAINIPTKRIRRFDVASTGHTGLYSHQIVPNPDGSFYMIDYVSAEGTAGTIDQSQGTHIGLYRAGQELPSDRAGVPLSQVVSDLCVESGLTPDDIDVTELTDIVDGFLRPRTMPARTLIEALTKAYHFDCVESDFKLKFPKRARDPVATIDEFYMIQKDDSLIEVIRGSELELPMEVRIKYMDFLLDYDPGIQYARRDIVKSDGIIEEDIAVVITADEARNSAQAALLYAWVTRDKFQFATSMQYAHLDPSDIVLLPLENEYRHVRITRQTIGAGMVEFEAAFDVRDIFDALLQGAVGGLPGTGAIPALGVVTAELIDTPLLRDADEGLAYYWASARTIANTKWTGALLYRSSDGGASYSSIDTIQDEAALGTATSVLGRFFGGDVRDQKNVVEVTMTSDAQLSSATYFALMNGANLALLGDELIQFQTAVSLGSRRWRISSLLRGRRGTEWAINHHGNAERFVLLTSAAHRLSAELVDLNSNRSYKAVMSGRDIASAQAQSFVLRGQSLRPYAPVHITGHRSATEILITWHRRTRVGGALRDGGDILLSESAEAYEIEIWDATFTTRKRLMSASAPSVTYSQAQMASDFGGTPDLFGCRVYQLSATVGRGFPGAAVL